MRITSNILNEASKEAGLPLTGNSLVNQLNGDSSSDSLTKALDDKYGKAGGVLSKENYEKLAKAAENLRKQAEKLAGEGSDALYAKAEESGDASEVYESVASLVEFYNKTMEALRKNSGTMNDFYRQSMQAAVKESAEALKEIGITVDRNGKMTLDSEKLKSAELSRVKSLLGSGGTVSGKLSLIAEKVSDNASANAKSASSQYDASGHALDSAFSRYDKKG